MVLCLWRPARQAECRAPSLEPVRPQLLCKVVTLPLHLPKEGKKGQNVQLLVQKTNSLSIYFNGMLKEYAISKTPLKARLENEKISIACIQETHLNPETRFSIRGYQAFRMDRMGHKGGVMILVKNEIPAKDFQRKTQRSEGTDNIQAEIHGVDITINQTRIKIFNIYCPDNKDLSLHNFDVSQENCIFLGDLNSHSTRWGYKANNARGDEIENWQI